MWHAPSHKYRLYRDNWFFSWSHFPVPPHTPHTENSGHLNPINHRVDLAVTTIPPPPYRTSSSSSFSFTHLHPSSSPKPTMVTTTSLLKATALASLASFLTLPVLAAPLRIPVPNTSSVNHRGGVQVDDHAHGHNGATIKTRAPAGATNRLVPRWSDGAPLYTRSSSGGGGGRRGTPKRSMTYPLVQGQSDSSSNSGELPPSHPMPPTNEREGVSVGRLLKKEGISKLPTSDNFKSVTYNNVLPVKEPPTLTPEMTKLREFLKQRNGGQPIRSQTLPLNIVFQSEGTPSKKRKIPLRTASASDAPAGGVGGSGTTGATGTTGTPGTTGNNSGEGGPLAAQDKMDVKNFLIN